MEVMKFVLRFFDLIAVKRRPLRLSDCCGKDRSKTDLSRKMTGLETAALVINLKVEGLRCVEIDVHGRSEIECEVESTYSLLVGDFVDLGFGVIERGGHLMIKRNGRVDWRSWRGWLHVWKDGVWLAVNAPAVEVSSCW